MSEEKKNAAELTDEQLSGVAGGQKKSKDYYCVYCRRVHQMFCFFPWSIQFAGDNRWYNNAERYMCEAHGNFYKLSVNGREVYLNELLEVIR